MKKSPAERYATANAFGEDIERYLRGDVVLAQPDSVAYRALKFARRHWVGIGAVGVLLLTLAGGLAATSLRSKIAATAGSACSGTPRFALSLGCSPRPPPNISRTRMWRARRASSSKCSRILNSLKVTHQPQSVCFRKFARPTPRSRCFRDIGDSVHSAAYSPDGTRIVTASDDKTARIWDARTGAQLAVLSGHGDRVDSAAYSPDGTRIVTASLDKTARIWDARTGAQLAVLSGHGDSVDSAAYSPDGHAHRHRVARQDRPHLGCAHGTQLAVLSGHGDSVDSAAYSPDGTRIVTASDDKTARIWDARTGAQLAVLSGHGDRVYSAAYSPDGTRIVTASYDKTARIWDARSGAPARGALRPWRFRRFPPPTRPTAPASSPRR